MLILAQTTRIGPPILGIIIPALIFGLSFFVAFYLYKRFTRKIDESQTGDESSTN